MNKHTGSLAFAIVLSPSIFLGCQSAEPVQSPADQAAVMARTRCPAEFGDAAVARVLDGSAVDRVEAVYDGSLSKGSNPRLQGAAIVVRPAQGETAEWLDRALECHGAKQLVSHARGSFVKPDPFWLSDSLVQIQVTPARDGLRIEVTGDSIADARELLARAQGLPRPENPTAAFGAR